MSNSPDSNTSMTTFPWDGCQQPLTGDSTGHTTGNGASSYSGLVIVRQQTHGPFKTTAPIAQKTKELWHETTGWRYLSPQRREVLDQIASKVARILAGNPNEPDHWNDIGGYAELGRDG